MTARTPSGVRIFFKTKPFFCFVFSMTSPNPLFSLTRLFNFAVRCCTPFSSKTSRSMKAVGRFAVFARALSFTLAAMIFFRLRKSALDRFFRKRFRFASVVCERRSAACFIFCRVKYQKKKTPPQEKIPLGGRPVSRYHPLLFFGFLLSSERGKRKLIFFSERTLRAKIPLGIFYGFLLRSVFRAACWAGYPTRTLLFN